MMTPHRVHLLETDASVWSMGQSAGENGKDPTAGSQTLTIFSLPC